jgi:hypothetical protein
MPTSPTLRRLAASTLVSTFGDGLFFTLGALYFTRIVGLSVASVGLGLTIAGGLGVVAGIPVGQLADRVPPRTLMIVLVLAEAAGTVALTAVHSYASFLLIVSVTTTLDRASAAVRATLYAVALPPAERTQARAYLRAVTNVGIGAGAAVAGVATGLTVARTAPRAAADGGTSSARKGNPALRDRPYLVVAALNAVLAMQFGLLEVGLPLWIVGHTDAPRAFVSVTLITNTVLCVALQVRAGRGVTSLGAATRATRRGGLVLAVACLVFASADSVPAGPAAAILVAGAIIQTLAEVISSAGGWAMSYDLADPAAPGAYQGVFNSGFALAGMLAPLVATATALRFGLGGWVILAAAFAAAGLALGPATRWAARERGIALG